MLFDKLINYLKLDKQEFLFQFNSHPNYPSALAFSDTLNFMGVRNDAYELDKEYWDELPEEFIAIVDNSFSLVKKSGAQYSIYSEKTKTLNKEDLHKKSTDFVLLFEKTATTESKSVSNYKPFIYIILAIIAIYSLVSLAWFEAIFNILSLVGVYISLEIFNQKFGTTSIVIGSICGGAPQGAQTVNSCNKIITQDKTSILGLKFSDFSLIYFVGIAVLGLFLPATSFIIKGFTFASVIAIGYSLYVQGFVEKTFCRVCLLIISVLVAQMAVGVLFFENVSFSAESLLLTLLLWVSAFSVILFLNNTLEEKETLQKSNAKNLRFKRNYELFKRELTDNEKINFTDKDTFFVGNKESKLHISIVSNPYCGFCKGAHQILEEILDKYPNDVSVQMRFNYTPDRADDKYTELLSNFMYLYKNKPQKEFLNAIELWYETRDENKIKEKVAGKSIQENLGPLINMSRENSEAGLNFTPVFIINGYQFPEKYDRDDIKFFINELLEDEDL